MNKNEEIITEKEWYERMLKLKIYDVLNIDWAKGITRVMNSYSGDIFDVSQVKIGDKLMLKVKLLE